MHTIQTGLHNSFHPTNWDGSTWSKFGARGEHGAPTSLDILVGNKITARIDKNSPYIIYFTRVVKPKQCIAMVFCRKGGSATP